MVDRTTWNQLQKDFSFHLPQTPTFKLLTRIVLFTDDSRCCYRLSHSLGLCQSWWRKKGSWSKERERATWLVLSV